jgi:hypothetical protein
LIYSTTPWHGNTDKALVRMDKITAEISDESSLYKLSKLRNYISNNADKLLIMKRVKIMA